MGRRFPPCGYCGKFSDLCSEWQSLNRHSSSNFLLPALLIYAQAFILYFWLSLLCILLCFDMHLPNLGSRWLGLPPPEGARQQLAHAFFCLLLKVWAFIIAKHLLLQACLLWVSGMSLVFPQQAHLSSASSLGSTYSYTSNITAFSHQRSFVILTLVCLYYPKELPTPELFWNGTISSPLAWKMSQEWKVLTHATCLNVGLPRCTWAINVSETVYPWHVSTK